MDEHFGLLVLQRMILRQILLSPPKCPRRLLLIDIPLIGFLSYWIPFPIPSGLPYITSQICTQILNSRSPFEGTYVKRNNRQYAV